MILRDATCYQSDTKGGLVFLLTIAFLKYLKS